MFLEIGEKVDVFSSPLYIHECSPYTDYRHRFTEKEERGIPVIIPDENRSPERKFSSSTLTVWLEAFENMGELD